MKRLRSFLDRIEPLFVPGGRFVKFHALFEMVDTLFYSPPDVARGSLHIRDALDLKRVMILVVFAVTPAAIIGMWNTGFQACLAPVTTHKAITTASSTDCFTFCLFTRSRWPLADSGKSCLPA